MYLELHAASAFSFLTAATSPEGLVERAAVLDYPAVALLDRDGVYGIPRFHRAAQAAGIRAIVGCELTMHAEGDGTSATRPPWRWSLPVLVESRTGYRNLCRLVSRMKLRAPKGQGALTVSELDGHVDGLVALVGHVGLATERYGVGGLLDRLVGVFGRRHVYVEIQRHLHREQERENEALVTLASAFRVPVVATNGVRYAAPADRPLFDVLTCIRHGTDLDRAGRRLSHNGERYLKSEADMRELFRDHPAAVVATRDLGDRLAFTMADLGYRFPEYPVPDGGAMPAFLRQITDVGARERYRPFHEAARRQIARELDLIEKLDLAGYFLIVWDLVNFCRREDILVQGRGSAANSAVCYSLGITAVDPVGMDLLFERFLSEERGEWPDVDLDLPSGDRRERVIQYVYEKYGRLGAAMTANVITYRSRSAARGVGKALALDPSRVDHLAKVLHGFEWTDPEERLDHRLRDAGLSRDAPRVRQFVELWRQIQHLPRHLGQHSGGMVICQGRLDEVVPLEPASMPGRVVVQWDKDDCAEMGIVKVDLLGLGMMAALQDALELINRPSSHGGSGASLDLAHLPPDDPAVYRMLQTADTIGVFQVESRAQMATLPRLRPERFYDIVVEVALIRPGPIVGQMVHPYLDRRAGRQPVSYPHPSLEPILRRTLGVPLFQEQLLRMAMTAAGFTGGEAEELRRAFGFKRSVERMRQIEVKLRAGMARRGIEGEAAEEIVRSISSFALYGFPESHAASFALIVYASAFLKAHYPAVFYTALLNNQPMGFYHPATLVKDAQRRGVRFACIDVQHSDWICAIEPSGVIRLGLRFVAGLREAVGRAMATGGPRASVGTPPSVRTCPKCGCEDWRMIEASGPAAYYCSVCAHDWKVDTWASGADGRTRRFESVEDLIIRTGANRSELATLAEIGALNDFGRDRRSALWQIERAVRPAGPLLTPGPDGDRACDENTRVASPLLPMTSVERVIADYAGTGLTIGPHPMAMRRGELALRGVLRATDLPDARHGRRVRIAGAVITRQRPGTAKGFVFLTLEDETGIANVIVRPEVFDRQRAIIIEEPFVVVDGTLQIQEGVTAVKAERVERLPGQAPRSPSHDFY